MGIKIITDNRKARFNFEILEKLEVGLVLQGSEVKALRDGRANLVDGFVGFKGNTATLFQVHISPYSHGGAYFNHEPTRPRRILMHKKEILRWQGKLAQKGLTAIPLKLYLKDGKVKCELGMAKGKKNYDKRESLKQKTLDKEARAAVKDRGWR